MKIFDSLVSVLFPRKCQSCGRIIESGYFCKACRNELKFVTGKRRCLKCGLEKSDCQCSSFVYHFERLVSPFEYDGTAKNAVLRFKFNRNLPISDFFVKYMCKTVNEELSDIHFDAICFVPTSLSNRFKRGFDQCEILAKAISKVLDIPLADILHCNLFHRSQHKSSFAMRLENVKGKYSFKKRLNGGNILLVDDIKTTGATLDECARQLLFAGADKVYCVTALITVFNKKH